MKAPVLALTVAVAAFAASSVYLWSELREERARAAQVEATTLELKARIAELEKSRVHLAQNSPAPVSRSATPQATRGQAEMQPEVRQVWEAPSRDQSGSAQDDARGESRREPAAVREFAQKIGLSKEETNQLIDLLTDQQLAGFSQTHSFVDSADFHRHYEEVQRQNDAAIADLIGSDKAAQLKEYQRSLPARMEFEMLAQQLDGSDAPLSAEQRSKLPRSTSRSASASPSRNTSPAQMSRDHMNTLDAWNDDFSQRFRSRANNVLNFRATQCLQRNPAGAKGNARPARRVYRGFHAARCGCSGRRRHFLRSRRQCRLHLRHRRHCAGTRAGCTDEGAMSPDEQQIRDLVATWMSATSAGDIDTVLSLMTDDVVFLVAGTAALRQAAVRRGVACSARCAHAADRRPQRNPGNSRAAATGPSCGPGSAWRSRLLPVAAVPRNAPGIHSPS